MVTFETGGYRITNARTDAQTTMFAGFMVQRYFPEGINLRTPIWIADKIENLDPDRDTYVGGVTLFPKQPSQVSNAGLEINEDNEVINVTDTTVIVVNTIVGAYVLQALLHELVHVKLGPSEHHSEKFWATLAEKWRINWMEPAGFPSEYWHLCGEIQEPKIPTE